MSDDCIFCKIVKGELPCHKVWEDEKHIAFLSIFPNTDGFTVVTTKKHYPSYAFDLDDKTYSALLIATKTVGKLLDAAFDDVGRSGVFIEGFGVDHVHTKLAPLHGTGDTSTFDGKWRAITSKPTTFYENYPGFLSSHDAERADDEHLAKLAKMIRETKNN